MELFPNRSRPPSVLRCWKRRRRGAMSRARTPARELQNTAGDDTMGVLSFLGCSPSEPLAVCRRVSAPQNPCGRPSWSGNGAGRTIGRGFDRASGPPAGSLWVRVCKGIGAARFGRETFPVRQAKKEETIVLQNLRLTDSRQSRDEKVHKQQNQIGRMIITPRRDGLENSFEPSSQSQLVAKALNQEETTEVGQRLRIERKPQCLQAFSHVDPSEKRVLRVTPITSQLVNLLAHTQNRRFARQKRAFLLHFHLRARIFQVQRSFGRRTLTLIS